MSIERLYSRECPKSQSGEATSHGLNPMTPADILNILAQVQHHEPVGNAVLEAKIQLNNTSRAKLLGSINKDFVINQNIDRFLSAMLAYHVVREVCDTCICPKCKGNGSVLYKKESRLVECKNCTGIGRIVYTTKKLYLQINKNLSDKLTFEQFNHQYYDKYMKAVDNLHVAESKAKAFAHEVMDRIAGDMAA
jgi:DnaJ-class molecular chaperone